MSGHQSFLIKRTHRDCGVWEPLRQFRRRLITAQNHPHYVGNNNESLRLDQVIKANPPEGGMDSYIRDLNDSVKH